MMPANQNHVVSIFYSQDEFLNLSSIEMSTILSCPYVDIHRFKRCSMQRHSSKFLYSGWKQTLSFYCRVICLCLLVLRNRQSFHGVVPSYVMFSYVMFSAKLFLTKDWATSTHLGISLRNHWPTPKWLRNELCSLCWTVPSGHTPLSICLFGINCPWCALWRKADGVREKNIWIYRLEGQTAYVFPQSRPNAGQRHSGPPCQGGFYTRRLWEENTWWRWLLTYNGRSSELTSDRARWSWNAQRSPRKM